MSDAIKTILAAGAGGAVGAALRYLFLELVRGGAIGILLVNTLGCFALGALVVALGNRADALSVFLATGLLGGLTTYSTYASDVVRLAENSLAAAAAYVAASFLLGIGAFLAGGFLMRGLA